jgi:hypothetical protein
MKSEDFRKIALSMPEVVESSHMGHPDFRVKNKIFATLLPRDEIVWGMVKLTPAQQKQFVKEDPEMFQPIPGGWGLRGATQVCLKAANKKTLRRAMFTAWLNTAPKSLIKELGIDDDK